MKPAENPENGTIDEPSAVDDPRVTQALEEYLSVLEAGQRPDRRAFLAGRAEIAEVLAGCLDSLEMMYSAAPEVKPVDELPAAATVGTAGTPLGDFRILREIGRGGMGIVYEAVQLSLDRRVALKVLPFAAALDPRHLHRFKNEAQAAAHLHHTHIVPVYAVGCERGVYYYAMQFIEGKTLANWIHELRWLEGLDRDPIKVDSDAPTRSIRKANAEPKAPLPPQPRVFSYPAGMLPSPVDETARPAPAASTEHSTRGPAFFRTIARLAVQAAEALEHAHQQGIIHRDIKPANLLLDDREHLWVADFGLARCQNDAGLTTTGDLVGTIRYMSPEQALAKRGLIDHRTDIYSLGATLYELLTLEPVFPGTDRQELLRQIANDDPRPLRGVRRSVPRELETIVLKALAKSPEDRYATAQDFADDLRRFLEDRPIQARRPTLREKAGKWLRRHRSVAFAAVAGLLLAVVGLAVSCVFIAREQARTEAALLAKQQQHARAEQNFQQAREVLDYLIRVAEVDMADNPEMHAVRRKLLEAACDYYREFIDQHQDDPTIGKELAESRDRVIGLLKNLGSRRGLIQGFLLAQKSVQDDLELSDELRQNIEQKFEQRRNLLRDRRNRSPEEWGQFHKDLAAQDKQILALLTSEQTERLDQIALQITLQQRGLRVLLEPEVAEALKLSDEQKQRIRASQEPTGGWRFGPRPGGKRPPEIKKDGQEQVAQVLTPEQAEKWQELTGEPFEGEIRHGPPPGRGQRHRRHP